MGSLVSVCRLWLCAIVIATTASAAPPSFLVILTDDHGWSELSESLDPSVPEARSGYLETPHIDRLGREGIRFTSGYSPAPLCTPTRRSILCGTTAARSGSEFKSAWVPADHLTIPRALKSVHADYRCAHFGKWGEQMISTPQECGYDSSDGMTGNNTGGMPATLNTDRAANHNTAPFYTDQPDPKLTGHVTDAAIAFIRESAAANKPFYVQSSYYAAHLSIVCREETLKEYQAKGQPDRAYTAAWAAMLDELDAGIGRLLGALEAAGVADETYVVFTTDNGGRGTLPGGDSSRLPPNHPLTGAKHSLHEGGIRVPFLVRGPGIKPGVVCRVPVAGYDLLPTVYDLAGGTAPLPAEVDGVSLRPVLENPESGSVARPAGGLIFHRPGKHVSAIREGEHKLLITWDNQGAVASRELFDVSADPREAGRDIAPAHGDLADQLEQSLRDYLTAVSAEKPTPRRRLRKPRE
jgi:arylsulfatase A-like enzyme